LHPLARLASRLARPRRTLLVVLALAVIGLTACGGAPPPTSWPGVTVDGDVAYVAYNQFVYAVDLAAGSATKKWQWPAEAGSDSFYGEPTLTRDGLLIVGSYNHGTVYALDTISPTQRWSYLPPTAEIIPGVPYLKRPGGQIVAGAAFSDGVAYVPYNNGQLHAVQTTNGSGRLLFSTADQNGLMATPVLAGGTLYVTSLGHELLALDLAGTVRWTRPSGGPIAGSVSVAGDAVLVGTFGQEIVAVDAAGGDVHWRTKVDEWVWGTPQVFSDTIYAATLAGTVYALDLDGAVVWQQALRTANSPDDRPAVRAALLVTEDTVFAVSRGGWLYALDRQTGDRRAGFPVEAAPNGELLTQPRLWRGDVLLAPMGGDLPLLQLRRAADGTPVWDFRP
jgi:outer membrane protein assembly factor BamB